MSSQVIVELWDDSDWSGLPTSNPGSGKPWLHSSGVICVGTYTAPSGSVAWGSISGTLSSQSDLQSALNGKQAAGSYAASSHTHGNISNSGAIGSTANLPLITTTSGVVTVGSFGSTANTFCQGNDSRLSDARTPTAHNQAWSTITSTPTTLAGYGITDGQSMLVSGTSIKTINSTSLLGSGDITVGVSGTGSTDNAVLRADGAGGATLQSSAIVIDDLYTTSPNSTVNTVCLKPTGGTTNVNLALVPKGTGAFTLAVPDSSITGGNVRGANSIDISSKRNAATHVASGSEAVVIGCRVLASGSGSVAIGTDASASGGRNSLAMCGGTASGYETFAFGYSTVASGGNTAIAMGNACTASGDYGSFATGNSCTASGNISQAIGNNALATRRGQWARSAGYFAAAGDCQEVAFLLNTKTTNATPTTLFCTDGASRLTIRSGTMLTAIVKVCGIKSDGSAAAVYWRLVAIKNVGGTTSLVGSVQILGTDIEDNASTDVSITADDTNDALQINVTGIAGETWRWQANVIPAGEIAYGV